jgi:hypothetical protein
MATQRRDRRKAIIGIFVSHTSAYISYALNLGSSIRDQKPGIFMHDSSSAIDPIILLQRDLAYNHKNATSGCIAMRNLLQMDGLEYLPSAEIDYLNRYDGHYIGIISIMC